MSYACFLIIYITGMVLIPIGFGIWKYDVVSNWEFEDYIIACFFLVIWPFAAFFGTCLLLALCILGGIAFSFKWLFKAGAKYRKHLIEKAYRKRHPEEFVDTCEECDGSGK